VGAFACLRFAFISSARRGGEEECDARSQHGKHVLLCLGFVLSTSRFQTSLPHSYPCSSWWLCLEGVRGRRGGRGLDTRQRFQQTKHHHITIASSSKQARFSHSPHQHYHHYTHTGHSTTSRSMSRMVRKGLDTLGKALRETGQALDRAGLEALGTDKHKELCKYTQLPHVCGMNACPCPLINTSV